MTADIISSMRPITLFRMGRDTLEIANLTGMSEAEVLRAIHKYRTRQIYKVNRVRAAIAKQEREGPQLIKYAGHPG